MKKLIKPGRIYLAALFLLCVTLLATNALANDIWTRDKLTGDWGGLRSDLTKHGVQLDFRLTQFYQGVTNGGTDDDNFKYGGKMDYLINIDGHKLGLWEGLFFKIHAETQFGNSIIYDAGGSALANTSMLYPEPDESKTAITGFLVEQALSKNFLVAAGKIHVVDLWTMVYPQMGGGIDGFMNTNMLAAALPWLRWVNLSVLGAGALALTDDGQVRGGVVVFDLNGSATTSGFSKLFDDGAGLLALWRFFFDIGQKPGSLLFAAGMAANREYDSLEESDWGFEIGKGLEDEKKDGVWTTAVYYEQILWQEAHNDKRNLRLFTGCSLSDGDPSFGRWGGYASVEAMGLICSRPNDRIGVGGFFNQISSDLKHLTRDLGVLDLENIWGAEIYYNVEATPWMHLTADAQLVDNENRDDSMAVILGLRMVIDF
jgi:porin